MFLTFLYQKHSFLSMFFFLVVKFICTNVHLDINELKNTLAFRVLKGNGFTNKSQHFQSFLCFVLLFCIMNIMNAQNS